MKNGLQKEIKIYPSIYTVVLPSVISYIIVFLAYYNGEDGPGSLALLIFDPFIFLYLLFIQKNNIIKTDNDRERVFLFIYFFIQIFFGIILLVSTYSGKPHWDSIELYMRWIFWASVYNIVSGVICMKTMFGQPHFQ